MLALIVVVAALTAARLGWNFRARLDMQERITRRTLS
jgi:hypothetical protein